MDTNAISHPHHPLSRTLELTVLTLEDLRDDWKPVTKSLYVVVRAESINSYTTGTAKEGGEDGGTPTWNEKLTVDVPAHARSITLEVKCKNSPKDVGVARIAVSDFLGGAVQDQCLQFLSYTLRDWEGRRSGVLNFSVKVKDSTPPVEESSSAGEGVVLGVPVCWNNDTNRYD